MKSILCAAVFVAALVPAAWSQDSTTAKGAPPAKPEPTESDSLPAHIGSAYRDYSEKQSFSLFFGYFGGNRGSAGVGPQGSAIAGLGYLIHLGGPANAFARFSYAKSQRDVVDPALPPTARVTGPIAAPLYMIDIGVTADVTGEKLWHGMTPYAGFDLGLANGSNTPDAGGYKFGTQFYVGLGGGLKYQVKGPWVVTMNAWFQWWQLHYPPSYFEGTQSVLPINAPDKDWTTNGVYTIGLSYLFKR